MRLVKIAVLHAAKSLGLFTLTRKLTAGGLQILCYHGFSHDDEHRFNSQLFVSAQFFKRRLEKIVAMDKHVISLAEGIRQIGNGAVQPDCVVITVDDGWHETVDIALPLLSAHGFPWTLYLSTYYAEKQTQILNVYMQYICWKTIEAQIECVDIDPALRGSWPLGTRAEQRAAGLQLTALGQKLDTADERQDFVRHVAVILKIDQLKAEKDRLFYGVSAAATTKMAAAGADIELHTHCHTLVALDYPAFIEDLRKNRAFIEAATGSKATHFCYPSGFYEEKHLQWLQANGVVSATTARSGLNYSTTPLLALNRFLDGENIADIEFEAELSGFLELARKVRGKLRPSLSM
jgi:peptidoglycan/xylan/chitin deacetylase (PgdA/CDA1 family)